MNKRQVGRAFVLKVIARLKELDQAAYEVAGSGAGLEKGDLRIPRFDIVGECKDSQVISMGEWTDQSEKEGLGYNRTVLFWRHPKSPRTNPNIRVDISLDFFMEMVARFGEPMIKKTDREFRWKLGRLVQTAKEIIKELEG